MGSQLAGKSPTQWAEQFAWARFLGKSGESVNVKLRKTGRPKRLHRERSNWQVI
jgi:hypothetical protein